MKTERPGVEASPGGTRLAGRPIDLRSDTVTQPTETMREAMARAEVGDDVFDEAPTVNALEALATVAGTVPRPLEAPGGCISGARLEAALRPPDVHYPPARLVVVENTHNRRVHRPGPRPDKHGARRPRRA